MSWWASLAARGWVMPWPDNCPAVEFREVETPFGKPSGPILLGSLGTRRIAFLNRHGEGHKLSPSAVPYAANIFALKQLGVHAVIASGAVGSLRDKIAPGHLVLVNQFIDKTCKRENTFFRGFGAVHCEMAEPVCGRLREALVHVATGLDVMTHLDGTYVCMEGPQFSTRAESLMHQSWGGDLIGMTALPEAKLAREAQMCYALVALASDYDCWRPHDKSKGKQTLLKEILSNLKMATDNSLTLIQALAGQRRRGWSRRIAPAARAWSWPSGRIPATSTRMRRNDWRLCLNEKDNTMRNKTLGILMTMIAVLLLAGCQKQQQQEAPNQQQARLLAAQNAELQKQLTDRKAEIETLQKRSAQELRKRDQELIKCKVRIDALAQDLKKGIDERVKSVAASVLDENAKLRQEVEQLKAQIEKLKATPAKESQ